MARSYLTAVNLNGNTLYNAVLHPQGPTAPTAYAAGQVWYDTTNKILKVYDGSWNAVGNGIASAGAPTTVPSSAGSFYFDTTNLDLYVAKGNSASSDWAPAVSGAKIPLNKVAAPTANYDISGSGYTIRATAPVNALDVVNKSYVDGISSGINSHDSVLAATNGQLAAYYYPGTTDTNGGTGIGAYIQATANGFISIDSVGTASTPAIGVGTRILVKDGVTALTPGTTTTNYTGTSSIANGIYYIASSGDLGSASTPWKLTRATDYNDSVAGEVNAGDLTFVQYGTTNNGQGFVMNSLGTGSTPANSIKIGTDTIKWTQFSGAPSLTWNSPLSTSGNAVSVATATTTTTGVAYFPSTQFAVSASGAVTIGTVATNILSGSVSLTTQVSGILPIGNGGTGSNISSATVGQFLVATSTSAFAPRALAFTDLVATSSSATSNTTSAVVAASGAYSIAQKLGVTFTGNGSATSFTITHALGRFVHVQVTDSTGLQVECDVTNTATTTQVLFAIAPTNGTIYYATIIG